MQWPEQQAGKDRALGTNRKGSHHEKIFVGISQLVTIETWAGGAWKTQKPLSIPNLNNLRSSLLLEGKSKLDMKGS